MPRPRMHDPQAILDVAESLAVRCGPAAVTIRAVGDAVGVSNGALYHEFGSRSGLLTRAWLRAVHRLQTVLTELVETAEPGAAAIAARRGVDRAGRTPPVIGGPGAADTP